MRASLPAVFVLVLGSVLTAQAEDGAQKIETGSRVSIEYTLKLPDGTTADSNVGSEPLVYTQGEEQILPALELALAGLEAGDTKAVTLTPEDGYGVVRPELQVETETEKIPEDGRHAGAMLMSKGPDGRPVMVRVKEVNGDKVVLDLNHPLAGQTLHFDVKILGVE